MIVNFILMFKGIEGVDKYLAKHKEYFMNKSYTQTRKFMEKYLNREFKRRENSFAFLDYLDNSKIEGEFYPELIRKSEFYKTMIDDKDKLNFIDAYLSYCGEESIINDCIDNMFDVDVLKDLVTEYVTDKNAQTIADKLIYMGDMDLILASRDYWYYLVDYLNANITDDYSYPLEEITTYLINYSNHNKGVITVLTDYLEKHGSKERVLTALADIITTKVNEKNDDNTSKYIISDINNYLDNIFNNLNNETFREEDINYIAKEIEKTNNKEALREWACKTKCRYNYQILDNLMLDYDNLPYLFGALDKFYVNHITTRILMGQSKEEKQKFMEYLSQNYNLFDREVLDKVLFLAYTCSYHVSKQEILGFVLKGSRYTRQIFQKYDFNEEERLLIFETYKNNQEVDLCTLYGTYLIKGERSALLNKEEEEKMKPLVLSLKKKIDDNKKLEVIWPRTNVK